MPAGAAWLEPVRLLVILDARALRAAGRTAIEVGDAVLSACPRGAVALLDRDQTGTPDGERLRRLRALVEAASGHGAALIAGGRADLCTALALPGTGTQLPERGLPPDVVRACFPGLAFGRSCHDRAGLVAAAADGASWATLAPVAPPLSAKERPSREPHGIDRLSPLVDGVPIPVFALGGMDMSNVAAVARTGVSGVACVGAVVGAPDPGAVARALVAAFAAQEARGGAS